MTAYQFSVAALVVLLFPMVYFAIASLTFFLASLSDPVVTRLLRGLFSSCFLGVTVLGAVAALAFASAGRPGVALPLGLLAACAAAARGWFLRRLDAQIRARAGGDGLAVHGLRRLHVRGIASNAAQLAALLAAIPGVFPAA